MKKEVGIWEEKNWNLISVAIQHIKVRFKDKLIFHISISANRTLILLISKIKLLSVLALQVISKSFCPISAERK